jgi:hypothetical protein
MNAKAKNMTMARIDLKCCPFPPSGTSIKVTDACASWINHIFWILLCFHRGSKWSSTAEEETLYYTTYRNDSVIGSNSWLAYVFALYYF